MNKFLLIIVWMVIGWHTPHSLADTGFVPLAPIPGLTDSAHTSAVNESSLADFFNNLYIYLIGLAAVLAIIEIIWGGLEIATQDSVSKHADGKQRIQDALLGLVLVLAPVLVFSVINPSILNLSLNLPKLDTATQGNNPAATSGPTAQTQGECSLSGTLLKKASCQTEDQATAFSDNCKSGKGNVFASGDGNTGSTYLTATCETSKGEATGPYTFATSNTNNNLSNSKSFLQPLNSASQNSNNGNAVINFSNTCLADGGHVCIGDTTPVNCPSATVNGCVSASLSCIDPKNDSAFNFSCSKQISFTVITP